MNASIKRFINTFSEKRRMAEAFDTFARANDGRFPMVWGDRYEYLPGKPENAMPPLDYLLHAGWAAREIVKRKPSEHVDISSVAYLPVVLSSVIKTTYVEYRPTPMNLSGLSSVAGDLCSLPFADDSIESLSCLHVLEHIGLGRYGDPINPKGDIQSVRELIRVLAPGGHLFIASPMGPPKIQFDAHRIYSLNLILELFAGLSVVGRAYIPNQDQHLITEPADSDFANVSGGCGCFVFRKI